MTFARVPVGDEHVISTACLTTTPHDPFGSRVRVEEMALDAQHVYALVSSGDDAHWRIVRAAR